MTSTIDPRLAAALLPALVHRINNTTQLLVVLRSLLADPDDGVLAVAGPDLARAAAEAEQQGWLLGILARSVGTDVLLAREERRGLGTALALVAEALRRERKELTLPKRLPTITLCEGCPRSAPLCLDLAALVWSSCQPLAGAFELSLVERPDAWELRLSRGDLGDAALTFARSDCGRSGARLVPDGEGWRLLLPHAWLVEMA
jgi:hypothetical protein